jgi:aryl-alcohol dehydrogenase
MDCLRTRLEGSLREMPISVNAAVIAPNQNQFDIRELELDEPRTDEILVRIHAAGVCHTDITARMVSNMLGMPIVLGHEGAGVVERVGDAVRQFLPGDRVALSYHSCGQCPQCSIDHPSYCHRFRLLNMGFMRPDGSRTLSESGQPVGSSFFSQSSFATHALVYERNCVRLPDDIPFKIGAPFGCGVQTGAGSMMNALACRAGSAVVIAGCGAVGLSAVLGAKQMRCATIIAVEPFAERRTLALEFGATHAIDPAGESDLAAAIRTIVPGGVDYALDGTGRAEVLNALMGSLAPAGTLGCVTARLGEAALPGDLRSLCGSGLKIMGITEGDSTPSDFLPKLFDLYRQGQLPVDRMIKTFPFSQINEAIAAQERGECVKVVLTLE